MDKQADVLREGYGFGDAVYEIALGKSYEDTRAGMMKRSDGGGVYSDADAADFSKRLRGATGMQDSPLFFMLGRDKDAAQEFRYRLLSRFDVAEPEVNDAVRRLKNMVERNPDFFRQMASASGEDYGSGGKVGDLVKRMERSVKGYYVAREAMLTAKDMGMPVPKNKYAGKDPLLPVVEYLLRKMRGEEKQQKKYGAWLMEESED